MKWSESATVRFVELYREHECLWNVYCKKYKNKEMRQKAFESIREKMNWNNLGTEEIKQKIKNLRSTYNQELVKIKRSIISGCVGDDIYKPKVKWFPIMESVMMATKGLADSQTNQNADHYSDMECSDSVDVPESEPSPNIVIKTEVVSADETTAEQKEIKQEADIKQQTPNQSAKPVYATTDKQNHQPSPSELNENGKPKGTKRRLQKLAIAINELRKVNTILSQPEPSVQENVAFGTYVASVLNKLHPQQAILAQNEIQNILTRYRMDSSSTMMMSSNVTPNQRLISPQPQSPSSASSSSSQ